MRFFQLAGPAALLALAASVATAPTARAAYIVTFSQVGSNVIASGSGTINLGGLNAFGRPETEYPFVDPSAAVEVTGAGSNNVREYVGQLSGPSNFGSGIDRNAITGTGDTVGFSYAGGSGTGEVLVPASYASGAFLSDTATYFGGLSLAALGLTPGKYVYSFGSGANADTITVNVGATSSVPEPGSLALLSTGLLGLGLIARRRKGA